MDANEKTLNTFTTRVRQMILQYKELKKENAELKSQLKVCDEKVRAAEEKLSQAQNDYNSLKMARMIEVSEGDLDGAKDRVAKLIRDVNKCITLISEK